MDLGQARTGRFLVTAVIAFLVCLSWQSALRTAPPTEAEQDFYLTVRARMALSADPQLAGCNLSVRVKNRVAILWGPTPSAEVAERAVRILGNMIDFIDVRNELQVVPREEPRAPARPQFVPDVMPPPPSAPAYWAKVPSGKQQTAGQRQPGKLDEAPVLKVPAGHPANSQAAPERKASAANVDRLSGNLQQTILDLQKSDARFRNINVRLQAGTVVLSAPFFYTDTLHEFSRLLARVPGVERVVVNTTPN
jgi:osmotically-inducible protein OsmY